MAADANWKWRDTRSGWEWATKPQRITNLYLNKASQMGGRPEILNRRSRKCLRKIYLSGVVNVILLPICQHYTIHMAAAAVFSKKFVRNFEWHIEKLSVFLFLFLSFARSVGSIVHFASLANAYLAMSVTLFKYILRVCVCGLIGSFFFFSKNFSKIENC